MTGAPTMEEPWPLRVMLKHFQDWVGKLGQAWVAGEISKIRSAGSQTFFTLRDENGDLSADVMVHPRKFADLPRAPAEGDRVILLVSIQVTKQTKILLHEELLKIWEQRQKTVIFVTHQIDEDVLLSDRVIVLRARPDLRLPAATDGPARDRGLDAPTQQRRQTGLGGI